MVPAEIRLIAGKLTRSTTAPAADNAASARSNVAATIGSSPSITSASGNANRTPPTDEPPARPDSPPPGARRQSRNPPRCGPAAPPSRARRTVAAPPSGAPAVQLACSRPHPHNAAGTRQDPAVSVPSPTNAIPSATETAAPRRTAARNPAGSPVPRARRRWVMRIDPQTGQSEFGHVGPPDQHEPGAKHPGDHRRMGHGGRRAVQHGRPSARRLAGYVEQILHTDRDPAYGPAARPTLRNASVASAWARAAAA